MLINKKSYHLLIHMLSSVTSIKLHGHVLPVKLLVYPEGLWQTDAGKVEAGLSLLNL